MPGGVLYLDIDDEITSAAARIRAADGGRVVVVLPYGSRVATSRINFRLLARDAQTNGKRLSVVAGDAAARALAASAGLPVFASVAEYEASLEGVEGIEDDAAAAAALRPSPTPVQPAEPDASTPMRGRGASAGGAARDTGAPDEGPIEGALVSETVAIPRPRPASDDPDPGAGSAPRPEAAGSAPRVRREPAGIPAARVVADTPDLDRPSPVARGAAGRAATGPPATGRTGARRAGVDARRLPIGRTPLLLGAAVVALTLVVGAVGAYLYLPTATAVITPRTETIGPISLRIVADPAATAPDAENAVVPAQRITLDIEAADTFPATGRRVEETKATGSVRFENRNPTGSNTIPRGSVVSTSSGIRFRTDQAVTIAAAELDGLTIRPSRASVDVTAVDAGPEGNVDAGSIRGVPRGEEPLFLVVTNPEPTTGGRRDEFPRITQEDVDAAVADLTGRLATEFDVRLADPDLPGDTASVFPDTRTLGDPVFTVDPASFVGQELESFELGATAQGTVLAVDTAPVRVVAEETIASSVEPGYELIAGSSEVQDAPAEIRDGAITFPVVVTAEQVLLLDPADIEAQILGKPLPEARAILGRYGTADLRVWPDWVATVPTLDGRVDVQAVDAGTDASESPSGEDTP